MDGTFFPWLRAARADSYGEFPDTLEVDRFGLVFVEVRKAANSEKYESVAISAWTRVHPDALLRRIGEMRERPRGSSVVEVTRGPIRTLFRREFDFEPGKVRITHKLIALLDDYAINYGELQRRPAVQIFSFDGRQLVSLRLEDIFKNGMARYHVADGRVSWLRDAWFDSSGKRLIIVSPTHRANAHGNEVAVVSIEDGTVQPADAATIKDQLLNVESRHLHSAIEVAVNHAVDGVDEVAIKTFEELTAPLSARVRAAAYLRERGNKEADDLIRSLADLNPIDVSRLRHPLISAGAVYDEDFRRNTIYLAVKILEAEAEGN